MTRQRITQISALFSTQQRETRKNKHSKSKKMDKMIQKLVQKTLSRYNEAHKALQEFDYDSIPVELRTEERSAARYGDDALLKLYKMEEDGTLEENKALVAKHLRDLEHYIIAVENIQIAFELGTMSEEEIRKEAKNVEKGWPEYREVSNRIEEVKNITLRLYIRRMYNRRVALVAYPLNALIEEQKFRAAEERIRRVQYGFKFAKMLIYQVL
jgi:hypothetical protein